MLQEIESKPDICAASSGYTLVNEVGFCRPQCGCGPLVKRARGTRQPSVVTNNPVQPKVPLRSTWDDIITRL